MSMASTKWIIYFFGALGGLLFGYDTGVISGAILFIRQDLHLNALLVGWVVSGVLVGAVFGAAVSGFLSDRFGRRLVVLTQGVVFCIGALGSSLSDSATTLILFRVVLGIAVGGASALVPLYLSEMAPAEARGALSSLNQLMIVTGILLAYIIDYVFAGSGAWRWMLAIGVAPAVMLIVGMLFMPESPRWLVSHQREDEARMVLAKTRNESVIENEIADIHLMEEQQSAGWKDLVQPWLRPVILVGVGLAVFQQFIGCNTVIYYAPTIFNQAGFGASGAIAGTIGTGIVNFMMTVLAIYLIDRAGRKPLLVAGNILMSLSLIVLGLLIRVLHQAGGSSISAWITVICLTIYIGAFAFSWGPVVWVMLGEIFPLKVRGIAMSVASMANWVANLIVSFTFPVLLQAVGISTLFLAYGVIGFLSLVFVRYRVVETKERSLEQIEAAFRSSSYRKLNTEH